VNAPSRSKLAQKELLPSLERENTESCDMTPLLRLKLAPPFS
jgi:hypothetical protein